MDKNLRSYFVEMIGVFIVVLISSGVICSSKLGPSSDNPHFYMVSIALAQGLILAVALTATVPISGGYLNPAVTTMLWVFKKIDGNRACWLIGAQLLGGILAGMFLRLVFTDDILKQSSLGAPHMNPSFFGTKDWAEAGEKIPTAIWGTGFAIECGLTFILTLAIFGTIIDPRAPRLGGIGPGLALTAIVLMAYPATGACVNPARWFGPVVWELTVADIKGSPFRDLLVYTAGPIFGALLGGAVYHYLVLAEDAPKAETSAAAASSSSPAPAPAPAKVKAKK